jgi:hypothetical protein
MDLDKILSMKRTAVCRCLILAVICGVILALPGGLLAAAGTQTPHCCHGRMAGQGADSCPCCQPHGNPGHGGNSCQGGAFTCHCSFGGPACLATTVTSTPTRQVTPYILAMVTISSKLLTPNIYHPPELNHLSAQI